MNVVFVTRGNFTEFLLRDMSKLVDVDVLVFSNGIIDKLDYCNEIDGAADNFYQLSILSKNLECVVICGCDTEVFGILHKSVIVLDNGKLLGVSDMSHIVDETEYSSGGGFRVYDTSAGKLGIIVDEDLFFPEVARILTLCDAECILCLMNKIINHLPSLMLRSSAFSNGVTMALSASGYAMVSDIKGEIICSLDATIVSCNLELTKDYHLIQARRRGRYREILAGISE